MIGFLASRFIKDYQNTSDAAVRRAYGVLCGAAGIAINLLLFALKLFAGTLAGSVAITADAFNNLSDAEKRNYFIPEGAGSYVGATPSFAAYLSSVPSMMMLGWYKDALNEYMKEPKIPNYGGAGGASGGTGTEDDLRGFSRDRRSLVINFNDKLVEWNSTITTDDPQEVMDDVSQNINALVSAAIQKSLLSATNSMNSRWY